MEPRPGHEPPGMIVEPDSHSISGPADLSDPGAVELRALKTRLDACLESVRAARDAGDRSVARRLLREAEPLLASGSLFDRTAAYHYECMRVELASGEAEAAIAHGEAVLVFARWCPGDADELAARVHSNLGALFTRRGEWAYAERSFRMAITIQSGRGDALMASRTRVNLAHCLFHRGRWAQAEEALLSAQECFARSGDSLRQARCALGLAIVSVSRGDGPRTRELLDQARDLLQGSEGLREEAILEEVQGDLALLERNPAEALSRFTRALSLAFRQPGDADVVCGARRRRAEALLGTGRVGEARVESERALELARSSGNAVEEGAALRIRALCTAAQGDALSAREDLLISLRLLTELPDTLEAARTSEAIADLLHRCEPGLLLPLEQSSFLLQARGFFASLGCTREVQRLDHRLAQLERERGLFRRCFYAPPSGVVSEGLRERFLTQDPRVLADLARIRRGQDRILLQGETGTGKDLLARVLHEESERCGGPFVVVDCGALPPSLVEEELFGFVRGTFTGADRDRRGLIEEAERGTLFFDEVGDLPLPLQTRLLRVVQERRTRRLGERDYRDVDFRLITATNRRLDGEVAAGRFRADLYYRLQGSVVVIPPLRERPRDIALLAESFFGRSAAKHRRSFSVSPRVFEALMECPWPGNVRELLTTIENLVLAVEDGGEISEAGLETVGIPRFVRGTPLADGEMIAAAGLPGGGSLAETVRSVKRAVVHRVLEKHSGNRSRAARELGISRNSLAKLLSEEPR